ncbi:hypothetical protein FISHEDRAFT_76163 [Fistulina hepatica ATCC 64428]|uniref:Uncharacterized protein n=1 Tax=Fistulina hepatica ATCC 64428 TaxID=1128425 RepID=A0A0D7A537_9AGAR|nr:hypothetical protein FISHEDRAFT_76163 [Fistulina hepatica ATCC 64428]
MKLADEVVALLPISSYTVTRPWRKPRRTIVALAVLSTIVYIALTTWNVVTQGKDPVYRTVLLSEIPDSSDVECQGDTVYASPNGAFPWQITGLDSGSADGDLTVGASYAGAQMDANITSLSMTYYWSFSNFNYGVCANVSIPQLDIEDSSAIEVVKNGDGSDATVVLSMCASFDLATDNINSWAETAQEKIENSFYDLAVYFQTLTFSNGTFPACLFPPYCDPDTKTPRPNDTTITPSNSYDLDAWMSGIRYLPQTTGSNYTSTSNIVMGLEHKVVTTSDGQERTFLDAFRQTYDNGTGPSGINLGITGIGAMHLLTQADNLAKGFIEPTAITTVRSVALGVLNVLGNIAINDLDNRTMTSTYLCTITSETWKAPWTLIAMVLGNNASLFGVWLALGVAITRRWEQSRYRDAPSVPSVSGPDPASHHVSTPSTSSSEETLYEKPPPQGKGSSHTTSSLIPEPVVAVPVPDRPETEDLDGEDDLVSVRRKEKEPVNPPE